MYILHPHHYVICAEADRLAPPVSEAPEAGQPNPLTHYGLELLRSAATYLKTNVKHRKYKTLAANIILLKLSNCDKNIVTLCSKTFAWLRRTRAEPAGIHGRSRS